ncbi:MAG: dihydroneopterin aldolase [Clostridia bacterium]|nr:dihydroneopterin aldolase [Clostridia bacterium]
MDKIIVKGLRVFACHGVNPEETQFGQNFELDITAGVSIDTACRTDNIDETVSYAAIIKTVKKVMLEKNCKLLEHAAQRVADALFAEFNQIETLTVTLKKPEAPMKADFGYVAVEIERVRK